MQYATAARRCRRKNAACHCHATDCESFWINKDDLSPLRFSAKVSTLQTNSAQNDCGTWDRQGGRVRAAPPPSLPRVAHLFPRSRSNSIVFHAQTTTTTTTGKEDHPIRCVVRARARAYKHLDKHKLIMLISLSDFTALLHSPFRDVLRTIATASESDVLRADFVRGEGAALSTAKNINK